MISSSVKAEVLDWISKNEKNIIDFCTNFIEYKSITGEEAEVQKEFLLPFLHDEMAWDDVDSFSVSKKDRPNVNVVKKGLGNGNGLLFNGHVDVVDVPESQLSRWTKDPWKPIIENNNLYGRGSTDMKGGITSMIWAIKTLMDLGIELKGDLGVELVVGEELMQHEVGTTAATKRLIKKGHNFPFCISTEPTNCEIHNVSNGTIDFEVSIQGKEVHSAERNLTLYPQKWGTPSGSQVGVDAVSKLIDLLMIFRRVERDWVHRWRHEIIGSGGYPKHEDKQGVGCFVINPSIVEGGLYIASVPGSARVHCQCYYPYWMNCKEVIKEIRKVVRAYSLTDDWLKEHPPKFTYGKVFGKSGWPPYVTEINHPGCKSLAKSWKETTGKSAQFSGFKAVNDLAFLDRLGIQGVSMGPGALYLGAHGPDEHVPLKQILDCTKTFAIFLIDWCGIK